MPEAESVKVTIPLDTTFVIPGSTRRTVATGVTSSADALFAHAAQVRRVALAAPASKSAIGKDTVGAVQSGLVYGYVALVEGMIARIEKEMGPARVIATGEMEHLIGDETQVIDVVDEGLTLKGMKIIYELNK